MKSAGEAGENEKNSLSAAEWFAFDTGLDLKICSEDRSNHRKQSFLCWSAAPSLACKTEAGGSHRDPASTSRPSPVSPAMLLPVCSFARKLSTEQEIYASAVRALTRRAHSIHEMREYLERCANDKEIISSVIARLREQAYLDDARYAADYARQHAQSRHQGRFRIARELRSRGVPDRHIDAALDVVFSETDEAALVRTRLKRSLAHVRGALDQRRIASISRSLLRAGFSADTIRAELRLLLGKVEGGVIPDDVPELDKPMTGDG